MEFCCERLKQCIDESYENDDIIIGLMYEGDGDDIGNFKICNKNTSKIEEMDICFFCGNPQISNYK